MGEMMDANIERALEKGCPSCSAGPFDNCLCLLNKPSSAQGTGMKFDGGKPRWALMMQGLPKFLSGVAKVLTFGAAKYEAHSWRGVPEGYERYRDALYRHLNAIERGETHDPESGLPHWYHVGCNVGFCAELDERLKE